MTVKERRKNIEISVPTARRHSMSNLSVNKRNIQTLNWICFFFFSIFFRHLRSFINEVCSKYLSFLLISVMPMLMLRLIRIIWMSICVLILSDLTLFFGRLICQQNTTVILCTNINYSREIMCFCPHDTHTHT